MTRKRFSLSQPAFVFCWVLGFTALIFLLHSFHLFEEQELGLVDLRFQLRGGERPHSDLVIVEIDDASVSRFGQWPWPRAFHAQLLNQLARYGPRLILYDILFTEPGPDPAQDEALAYSIERAGNVLLPFFFQSEGLFLAFFPMSPLREPARGVGYVNIFPDRDSRVRRIRREIHPKEGRYFHASVLAMLTRFRDEEASREWLQKIPVDRENSFWLNYPGDYSRFVRVPSYRILEKEGEENPELRRLIQGKIVLVGMTATGGGDLRPTPFSSAYPGIGIQASALHTLLTERYLRRFDGPFLFVFLLGFASLVAFLTWKYPPRIGILAALALSAAYFVWNLAVFNFLGWILPIFSVVVVILGTYVLVLFFQFVQVRFEQELIGRELSLAARIQENFLPREHPQLAGLDAAFQCQFARTVGGDLYDWVPLGERRLGVCVGDVSGKGVPAALYMARAISEFRALAQNFSSPSALLNVLNRRLAPGESGMFVTFLYLILDLDSKSLALSNAGHEPLLFYRKQKGRAEWVRETSGQPLGVLAETEYSEKSLLFEAGDLLFLISDGVRELRNSKGEEFGLERVEHALYSCPGPSAEAVVTQFFQAMNKFSEGNHAHDDRTVLCLKMGQSF